MTQSTAQRNLGIDILRIVSMFMVVVLHTLGQGGILSGLDEGSVRWGGTWLIETACYGAVDCYALISGYVMCDRSFKLGRIGSVWLQTFVYSVGITALFALLKPGLVSPGAWANAVTPVLSRSYWYFTAYAGLFLFIPYLNRMLTALSVRERWLLCLTVFVLFTVLIYVRGNDPFQLAGGFALLWVLALYLVGGCLKLNGAASLVKKRWLFLISLTLVLATWASKFIMGDRLFKYNSPTVFLSSAALLLLFAKFSPKSRFSAVVIGTFAPASFGVYLIHTHPLIWANVLAGRFAGFCRLPLWKLLGLTLTVALAIFIACSAVDYVRLKVFRLLRIDKLFSLLGERLQSRLSGAVKK